MKKSEKINLNKIYKFKRRTIISLSIILLIMIYLFKNASFLLRATTTIGFLILFYLVDHFFDVRFEAKHYSFILIISIFSLLLSPLYYVYPNYDKIQHFIQPMLVYSIFFFMVSKLKLELKWKLIFAFFITLSVLGFFEISEYILDYLFDLKLQGVYIRDLQGLDKFNLLVDRIDDTMIDLSLGFLGSTIALIFYYTYTKIKNKKKK
jgi:hypothetical protein